ncbi:unnamed protein product [Allacma fusca]|uniref:Uncharacterized protein n=2 Tax=Allacma fusca TaxID=39272 RepID=A0A8J2NL46_9HEXA|nr:unnamed protein product [Allacma fusca]
MLKSMQVKDTDKKEVRRVFLLGDWEGLDIKQVTHLPMSYAAEVGLQMVKPLLGGLFGNIELFGTNKAKWMKALKRILPPESIPTWYGGKKDYKPLQVYG